MDIFALHFLNPADANNIIDHWMHIRKAVLDDPEAGNRMNKVFRITFDENKETPEAIQAEELSAAPPRRPMKTAIDSAPYMYRWIVAGEGGTNASVK